LHPDNRQPFVGSSVFAHKGGIHVSALRKHPKTYEHINPELVGNKRRVLVSELAGLSNVLYKAEEIGINLDRNAPETKNLLETIKNMEHDGYQFEGAEASFELLMKKTLGMYTHPFELVGFRIISEKQNGEPVTEATIKVKVGSEIIHTAANGDGPVNALDHAMRKALESVYSALSDIQLADYKVRVLDGKSGTAAKVRVLIDSTDGKQSWGTVGVSTNIIEASWQALTDSLEYGIFIKQKQEKEDKEKEK
jgi:2-isopropylmalate synthase